MHSFVREQKPGSQPMVVGGGRSELQGHLTISAPEDSHEQEADRVARQVIRTPGPDVAVAPTAFGTLSAVQTARAGSRGVGETAVPPTVHTVARSPGQPLDSAARAFMEPRFGHDFSRVRVHTSGEAADSARALGALAYTVGQNIVFAPGEYTMASHRGRTVLAHELAHTLQAAHSGTINGTISRKEDPKEPPPCKKAVAPVRPVFLRNDAKDKSPTGHSLNPRLKEASRIWDKCGINFSASAPRTVDDKDAKVAGTRVEFTKIMETHGKSGSGPEVFFFDNALKKFGGGVSGPELGDVGDNAKIMLSDHGTNTRLLAHELGHAMSARLLHPEQANWVPEGTIMDPSGVDGTNPDVVTASMCALIEWPYRVPPKECWHPDPDPKPPTPPKAKDPKETEPPKK